MIVRLCLALAALAGGLSAANVAVNLSGTTNPAFANKLSDSDVQVVRFVMQASGGDVNVSSVTLTVSNATQAAVAFTGIKLFFDSEPNGTFDPGEQVGTTQTIAGATVTFNGTFTVKNGLIHELQVRVDIGASTAVYGEAFQFSIAAGTDIGLPGAPTDTVSGAFPFTGNALTIRNSVNQLVPGTGNPASPRSVQHGSQNVAALQFALDSLVPVAPGELVGLDLQSLAISITTQTASQTAAVSALALWQDDGDALFEPGSGEALILARTPADLGKWTAAGNVITVTFDGAAINVLPTILTGQARTFWVGISFAGGADCVCEVSVNRSNVQGSLGTAADFFVTSPTAITGNVITVANLPKPPAAPEAEGEGGCSTDTRQVPVFALLIAAVAGFASLRRALKRKL
ncbi:MAG: hypothetical protein HS108_15535 [Planctomycetes bacterium]|jgi:hypothetical protein|nr:hypothetical protein [Planctomycetota bacterium]MCL4730395.1 hypothetical protein [Planctomycetota bacterium]